MVNALLPPPLNGTAGGDTPGQKRSASAFGRAVAAAVMKFLGIKSNARRFHAEELGDEVDANFCFSDFVTCIAHKDVDRLENVYKSYRPGRTKAALAENSGITGGYTVPPEFRDDMMGTLEEEALIRGKANVQPMSHSSLLLPLPDGQTASGTAGVPSFFGGFNVSWLSEGVTEGESEPTFRQLELTAWELSAYSLISNQMKDDGGEPLDRWLRNLFGKACAWAEDYAFLRGDGVGKPLGILNAGATIQVTRAASNRFGLVDAAKMQSRLLPYSYSRAFWFVSVGLTGGVSAISEMLQLIMASGASAWIPNDLEMPSDRSMARMFGRPVYPTEKLPVLGTTGDVMLMDPSLYIVGDRKSFEIDMADKFYSSGVPDYAKNQSVWRTIHRVDGQPLLASSVTLQDQTTTTSPFIVLK